MYYYVMVYIAHMIRYPFVEVILLNKHEDKFHKLALNIAYYRKKGTYTRYCYVLL